MKVQFSTTPIVCSANLHKQNTTGNSLIFLQKNKEQRINELPSVSQNVHLVSFGNAAAADTMAEVLGYGPDCKVLFPGAEIPPYYKMGGVGTVMVDYKPYGDRSMPYHNGNLEYSKETGELTGNVKVHKLADGTPIFTNADLTKVSMDQVIKEGNYKELELLDTGKMSWGLSDDVNWSYFRVKNTDDYFTYLNDTAKAAKPYENGSYSYASGERAIANNWQGDVAAKWAKAQVAGLCSSKAPQYTHIISSDSNAAYIAYYIDRAIQDKVPGYERLLKIKVSHIAHNLGDGYCGETSAKNMLINLDLPKKQLEAIINSEGFKNAMLSGQEEAFLKKLMPAMIDGNGGTSAVMLMLNMVKNGMLTLVDTVSEHYGKAIADNPRVAPAIHNLWKELYEKFVDNERLASGIVNPLNDPNARPEAILPLKGYGQELKIKLENGTEKVFAPFEVFPKDSSYEQVLAIKNRNKINLFERLSGAFKESEILTGLKGRKVSLMGNIDPSWIEKIKAGDKVELLVSWGRVDFQKGLDIALKAFEEFGKTEEGKNTVFVLGGEMPKDSEEAKRLSVILDRMLKNDAFKGRLVFMNGFAPGLALSSAGDLAILPSRFAPCELTDLEALLKYCRAAVTNTQGMAQKNFDPRNADEAAKATSFKTSHEYYSSIEILNKDSEMYRTGYAKLLEEAKQTMKLRGVLDEHIENAAKKYVEGSKEYLELLRESADDLLVKDFIAIMKANHNLSEETARLMYENQKKLKTTWKNNNALHPSNESSHDMYKKRHIDYARKNRTSSNFIELTDEIKKILTSVASEPPKDFQPIKNTKWGKIILSGAIGLVAGASAAYTMISDKKAKAKPQENHALASEPISRDKNAVSPSTLMAAPFKADIASNNTPKVFSTIA